MNASQGARHVRAVVNPKSVRPPSCFVRGPAPSRAPTFASEAATLVRFTTHCDPYFTCASKKTAMHVDPRQTRSTLGADEHTKQRMSFALSRSNPMMISISASNSEKRNGTLKPPDNPALGQCALFIASTLLMGCQTRGVFVKRNEGKVRSRRTRQRKPALVRT